MAKFKPSQHILVPKHSKLNEKDKKLLLETYKVSLNELPKINKKDFALEDLDVKKGDIIKIIRKSASAGEAVFYRVVV